MYEYQHERPRLFTDDGQRMFLQIRDQTHKLIDAAGAVTIQKAIANVGGDSWLMLACIDRMIELGEIVRLQSGYMTQHHILKKQYT